MGWFELANVLGSSIFGAVMTMWAQKSKDEKERWERVLKQNEFNAENTNKAREHTGTVTNGTRQKTKAWEFTIFGKIFGFKSNKVDSGKKILEGGFHFTRRVIALALVFAIVVGPKILPVFFPDITVTLGYYDIQEGLWPWSADVNKIKWLIIGDGSRPLVISAMDYNIVLSVVSLFFGNQFVKR